MSGLAAEISEDRSTAPTIPVYRPDLSGREREYVLDCIESSWISSVGRYISRFEEAFCRAANFKHAASVPNGTIALHLALHALGIGPGDEVIVPTFTYIASVNSIAMTGATPVFVDCRPDDWLVHPEDIEAKITPRTRVLMPVHLYGAVCDMSAIRRLADRHGLRVVEDCAEALGSRRDGAHAGTFGDIATFSFYGNKTVTTGEGGMVASNDPALDDRVRLLKCQGQSPVKRYWHEELGFNYRMTNICAAIGLAQIERLPEILRAKHQLGLLYRRLLAGLPVEFQRPAAGVESSEWLVTVLLPHNTDRERVMKTMGSFGVETRPVFYCAHEMPMYRRSERFPHAEDVSARGISLPSYPGLTDADVERVASALRSALRQC
ncbi:MAG: DegT/DnrJ/EryC1/StrS aminotransferase family protein [Acidisphaera sp.]|nr:DegT/DnrJ/EryC1/StrS aminotransferase family protein [Acidisphaera sp.]